MLPGSKKYKVMIETIRRRSGLPIHSIYFTWSASHHKPNKVNDIVAVV